MRQNPINNTPALKSNLGVISHKHKAQLMPQDNFTSRSNSTQPLGASMQRFKTTLFDRKRLGGEAFYQPGNEIYSPDSPRSIHGQPSIGQRPSIQNSSR